MPRIVVLEHTPGAGVSSFGPTLDARTAALPWQTIAVPEAEPLPGLDDDVAGVVVMGGIMSAVDPDAHPWMGPEIDYLRHAVAAEVPVFGVCLGAQLLGQALGGAVEARAVPEVAYLPLTRTPEGRRDEVVAGWPDGAAAMFLHEDEVATLPADAVPLLSGSDGTAAWRSGSALAVQFHPEITAAQIRSWVQRGLLDELVARAGADGTALAEEAARRERFVTAQGRALLGRFLDGPVTRRAQAMEASPA